VFVFFREKKGGGGGGGIDICIEYLVVPGKRFLYNGRERHLDFIGAGPLGRSCNCVW
jgi:hypothetical protein